MTKPWERQKGETAKAFSAFCFYRDLPPPERSIELAFQQNKNTTKSKSNHFRVWSMKYDWVKRAAAYDDHVDALEREHFLKERIKNKKKRIRSLEALQALVNVALNNLDPTEATFPEVANMVRIVTEQLRKEYNDEPTQRIESEGESKVIVKVVKGVSYDDL